MVHKRHFCILVGLLVIVVPGQPSRGDLCTPGLVNGSKYTLHRFSEEDPTKLRCCVRKTCHAGNYAIPCESEDAKDTTVCKPCPPMMWMADNHPSDLGKKCEPWRRCSKKLGLEVDTNGSSIRDRQCRCKLREGYYPSLYLEGRCKFKPDLCPEGKELKIDGSCGFCKPHMFKLVEGYGPCESCPSDSEKMSVNTLKCTPCTEGMKNVGDGCQTCAERLEHNQDTEDCTLSPRELPSETDPKRDRSGPNVVYIIVATCGVLLVCLILLIAVVLYMRKYKPNSKAGHGVLDNGRTSPSNSSDSTQSTVTDKDGNEYKLPPGPYFINQLTSLVVGDNNIVHAADRQTTDEGQTDYSDYKGQQSETAEPMVYENKVSNC